MSTKGDKRIKKLIFSTGAKGGVGKSTLAVLAIEALREAKESVACVEGDEHSPTLTRRYRNSPIVVADVDLAGLVDRSGAVAFADALKGLNSEWIVVNTPASGARPFESDPEILAAFRREYELRAAWSLSVNADRTVGNTEDDGILTSLDRGMLSAMTEGRVFAVKQPFQLAYRGQRCWYDDASFENWLAAGGAHTIAVEKAHPQLVELIQRDNRTIPEIMADLDRNDPVLGASLQLFWHGAKKAMADSILYGADISLSGGLKSTRGRLFGGEAISTFTVEGAEPEADEGGEAK